MVLQMGPNTSANSGSGNPREAKDRKQVVESVSHSTVHRCQTSV